MKVKEARQKYFEEHVEFEYRVKLVAKALGIKCGNNSLNNIIENVTAHPSFAIFPLNASQLKMHKEMRNWLAHNYKQKDISPVLIERFKTITKANMDLTKTQKIISEGKNKK